MLNSINSKINDISDDKKTLSPLIKLILEVGPLAVFYISNSHGMWLIKNISYFKYFNNPIFPATALFIIAIIISLICSIIMIRKIPIMPLISAVFVIILGGLTLWFHDETFIKIKPTIVNIIFATILLLGLLFKKSLLSYIFEESFHLDAEGWRKLTFNAACYFLFLALTNEIIWRNFSTNFWTNFKVFCTTPLTIIFFLTQLPIIMKHHIKR